MARLDQTHVDAINAISTFLAHAQVPSLSTLISHPTVIVLCGNSILPLATHVFTTLQQSPSLAQSTNIIITGGIGHSTTHLYTAVAKHPIYHPLAPRITDLPEADVLSLIQQTYHPLPASSSPNTTTPKIHLERLSTNCGANALLTRSLLDSLNLTSPTSLIIVQDPTMSLRTLASFQHAYSTDLTPNTDPPTFATCPVIVPLVKLDPLDSETGLAYDCSRSDAELLWPLPRFLDLIMGEIPRLRDDETGYGPKGKGFISHVDVPREVERAWKLLEGVLGNRR
jgi:hypothetical protein